MLSAKAEGSGTPRPVPRAIILNAPRSFASCEQPHPEPLAREGSGLRKRSRINRYGSHDDFRCRLLYKDL
jgi:hypothetical protein